MMKIYTKMYCKMFSNYLFGLCNCTEENCNTVSFDWGKGGVEVMNLVVSVYQYLVCMQMQVISDFWCLHTVINKGI
jgi:hypothetical protein